MHYGRLMDGDVFFYFQATGVHNGRLGRELAVLRREPLGAATMTGSGRATAV